MNVAEHTNDHGAAEHSRFQQHHFTTAEQQQDASKIGMWLFLVTEVLLFGGLFVGYGMTQARFPEAFKSAHHHLQRELGFLNTVVLLISSFTMVMAVQAAKLNRQKQLIINLWITIACACAFLVVKYFEYSHKFSVGQLPGKWYSFDGLQAPGANLFFAVYFLATGLHGLHVLIGMTVLGIIGYRTIKGRYHGGNHVGVELGVLYWHLVDLVWIFLFPLLYLI